MQCLLFKYFSLNKRRGSPHTDPPREKIALEITEQVKKEALELKSQLKPKKKKEKAWQKTACDIWAGTDRRQVGGWYDIDQS